MPNKNLNIKKEKSKFQTAFIKTWNSFKGSIPIIITVLMFISVLQVYLPKEGYAAIFSGNTFTDSFVGALLGSVSLGNPIISYIIGGELLKNGVSLMAITAFLVSWVTVGIIQIPVEAYFFGKKFALVRNIVSFFGAMFIGILTFLLMKI